MKIRFLIFETKSPPWVLEARGGYVKKIAGFIPFELKLLKSPGADRDQAEAKRHREGELLLKQLDARDHLILFDEAGRLPRNSEAFAAALTTALESGRARIVFAIGGPYGFDEAVKARAQALWSLSPLTLNHWVAQIAALEQVYRGFTIRGGLPYHNR